MAATTGDQRPALVFDVDGVLVDVSGSFRALMSRLVGEMTGRDATPAEIQDVKQAGGFNDDIEATAEILRRRGVSIPFPALKARFDAMYQGLDGSPGFWREERWLLPPAALDRLSRSYRLAVMSGRNTVELGLAARVAGDAWRLFGAVVGQDDLPLTRRKPAPDGILLALERLGVTASSPPGSAYVGDSVDDMTAARVAGVRAIGVLPPGLPPGTILEKRLRDRGAEVVLPSISDLLLWGHSHPPHHQ